MKTLLVDGNNIAVRALKACEGHGVTMSNEDGINTGPLVVFVNSLSRYVREERPDAMVVCWDGGRSIWRTAIHDGYKGGRGEAPTHEVEEGAFWLAKEFLTLANIHHVQVLNIEADDLIAWYWRNRRPDDSVVILSGDKDFFQLLDAHTEQVQPGVDKRWTADLLRVEHGYHPAQVPLVMALTGDAVDGIEGVPGFGKKTAIKALAAHGWSLDALLETTDEKWRKKLGDYADRARRNLALVDLRAPMPLVGVFALEELGPVPPFEPTGVTGLLWSDLVAFLRRYQLRTIEDRLRDDRLWRD